MPYACTHAWSYGGWAARSGADGVMFLEQFRVMEQRRDEAVQRRLRARRLANNGGDCTSSPAPGALSQQDSAPCAWWGAGWVTDLLAQSQTMAQQRGKAAVEAVAKGRAQARRKWRHGGRVVPEPMPDDWAGVCEDVLVQRLAQENWDEGRAQATSAAAGAADAASELQRQLRQRRRRRTMQRRRRRQRRRRLGSAETDLAVAGTDGAAPATGALGAAAAGQGEAVAGRKGTCEVPAEYAARRLSGRSKRVRAVKPRRARVRAANAAGVAAAAAAEAAAEAMATANVALLCTLQANYVRDQGGGTGAQEKAAEAPGGTP